MTEPASNQNSVATTSKPEKRPSGFLGFVMVMTMLIAGIGVIVLWEYLKSTERDNTSTVNVTAPVTFPAPGQQQLKNQEEQIGQLQARVTELTARLEKLEQTPPASASTTLSETSRASKEATAFAITFETLRSAANNGDDFTNELDTFAKLHTTDSKIQEEVNKLIPMSKGVPSVTELRTELAKIISSARTALNRTNAQTWQERAVAELNGMISIRRLDDDQERTDQLGLIDIDIKQHRFPAAIERIATLPESSQNIMRSWKTKVVDRQKLETSLAAIASHLITDEQPDIIDTPQKPVP